MRRPSLTLCAIVFWCLFVAPSAGAGVSFTVTVDPDLSVKPRDGRVILFFITAQGRFWANRAPMHAPFYDEPQPIASIEVHDFGPGSSVTLGDGDGVIMFGGPLSNLDGPVRVQAVFDQDETERGHMQGPGNLYSETLRLELIAGHEENFELVLNRAIPPIFTPDDQRDLKWIDYRSELLSKFYGRDIYHRAGVALPRGYHDEANADREWAAIYVVPPFGVRREMAWNYAAMYRAPNIKDIAPMAVTIVLDPESPLGHHGFVDSVNHGPRGTALVKELIPHLESTLRIVPKPEARIVTGHSSGGWSSLWLQLNWPDVFGACWASAPDPIDFTAFQMSNIYEDESVYRMPDGSNTPSYRKQISLDEERVAMTVEEEVMMEYAIHPQGGSGQQWDTWMAMFSPKDESTGYPARLFDAKTGRIDREVAEHWKQFDIARLVRDDLDRLGPIVTERVRLVCGELDCYYLHRAVHRFGRILDEKVPNHEGPGYVFLHPEATHDTIIPLMTNRWNQEMRDYLRNRGYQK